MPICKVVQNAPVFSTLDEAAETLSKSKESRKNIDDAFYIFDIAEVERKYKRWVENLSTIRPFYAVKVGPYQPLLEYLVHLGAGFDCASEAEVNMALQAGAQPNDIVFSNPTKQMSHMVDAKNKGVKLLTFDSAEELHKTKQCFPGSELLIRIWTDNTKQKAHLSEKYGVKVDDSLKLLQLAKQLELNVVGVSFHVGSPYRDPAQYASAIRDSRKVFDYAESIGMKFAMLDIGGGFSGVEAKLEMENLASSIKGALETYFPKDKFKNLKVIAEPGRYFAATSFALMSNVIAKKSSKDKKECDVAYTLNEGKSGSLTWIDHKNTPTEEVTPSALGYKNGKEFVSKLYGPTLGTVDVIREKISLPEMNVGEWIIWKNAGAHTFSSTSAFNGFKTDTFYTVNIKQSH